MEENTVSLKLPTFWSAKPSLWFAQAEAQFNLRKISADATKYYHVVTVLDSSTAIRVSSILESPPEDGKYIALKRALIESYELTDSDRANMLLNIFSLGDQKPSELMANILSILGKNNPSIFVRQIFLNALPTNIRMTLTNSEETDLRKLSFLADKMYASIPISHEVHAATSDKQTCYYHNKFKDKANKCKPSCPLYKDFQKQKKMNEVSMDQGNSKQGQ